MKKFVFHVCFLSVLVCVVAGTAFAIQSQKAKPNPERIPTGSEPTPTLNVPGLELAIELVEPALIAPSFRTDPGQGLSTCYGSQRRFSNSRPQIISQMKGKYTEKARDACIRGKVILAIEFRDDGTIGTIRVVRSLGYGLDEQAIAAARHIRFRPAMKDGQPVTITRRVEFPFNFIN
ncbi:MAG TPA: energy transducer TonB [Acidobacteriota bacterium]|nr:energy transducer TonB [Acidobacteriota bacterium]HNC42543.1 energy transducer TonB [Acidobacteriota bacterium]